MSVQKTLNVSEETQAQLARIAAIGYTQSGLIPAQCEWHLTEDQCCEIVKRITRTFVSDVDTVTIDFNRRNPRQLFAYVWIPKDSDYIKDRSLKGGNAAVNRSLTRISSEMREFMDKFCEKNKRRLLPEAAENGRFVGIEVRLDRFLEIEFDSTGMSYGKLTSDDFRRKTRIMCQGDFEKDRDRPGRVKKLNFIRVTKGIPGRERSGKPQPRRSYNA